MHKKANIERREYSVTIEKLNDDNTIVLEGYAAVFDSLSEDLGGFREVIRHGAFSATLNDPDADIYALNQHRSDQPLARRANGTLNVSVDARGLRIRIELSSTSYAKDLAIEVERGTVDQMSFQFYVIEDRWHEPDDTHDDYLRELLSVELIEVSPVTFPAYKATDIGVAQRALRDFRGVKAPRKNNSLAAMKLRHLKLKIKAQEHE